MSMLGSASKEVSVVIPTYNRASKLRACIKSVLASTSCPDEIIVVDDASTDDTPVMMRSEFPGIQYLKHNTETFPGGSINDGILAASTPYVAIVDDDNVIHQDMIRSLYAFISSRPEVGVVGPITYWLSAPNRIMYTGAVFTRFTHRCIFIGANEKDHSQFSTPFEVTNIPNCFMLRRKAALQAGLIDADLFTWYGEDGSLQDKITLLGFKVFIEPSAKTFHDANFLERKVIAARFTPAKIYYTMRTKAAHIRVFEHEPGIAMTRLISIPFYAAFYSFMGARFSDTFKGVLATCRASMAGSIDGALLHRGYYKSRVSQTSSGVGKD